MRTEVVTHDGATVTVRSAYRRTPIIESQYMAALQAAYPELVAFEAAVFQVDSPTAPNDPKDKKALERYRVAMQDYERALIPIRTAHRVGFAVDNEAISFVVWLARVSAAEGWLIDLGTDGRFDDASVVKAFEARLEEEFQDYDETGAPITLWGKIADAVKRVDAPLTPVDLRPPETLTEAEKVDPLSSAAA
jgi:hypothetical protein